MKCYLLDLENLPYTMKWASKQNYAKDDRVYIMYSEDLHDFYISNLVSLNRKCKNVHGIKIFSRSKNALDFNLAGIFGMLVQECIFKGIREIEIHIVSEDRGYEALKDLSSWSKLNFGVDVSVVFDKGIVGTEDEKNVSSCSEDSLMYRMGFNFYKNNKALLFEYVLNDESEEVRNRVWRALVGAMWVKGKIYSSIQKFFNAKEAERLYRVLKEFLENTTKEEAKLL